MDKSLVSIIVPSLNSMSNLEIMFESLIISDYKNFEVIINDDKRTTDNTEKLIEKFRKKGLNIIYKKENISMAQGRKKGVEFSKGKILLHLDSDMKISKGLISECVSLIEDKKYDALVIPEESYGTTFWAKCKWLEKKCYEGIEQMESLRCIKREIYNKLNGHNELMVFSEDKDLDLRVRKKGYSIGRTKNVIYHNEGNLLLIKTLKKKVGYSKTADIFAKVHPREFRWQSNIFIRYWIFLKNIKYLFLHPLLYVGMIFMKTSEFAFAGFGYIKRRVK
jgi:arabinofuranan 3-O-arabinosyltransferase